VEYRLKTENLLEILENWNLFLKKKVHLIACGGTAMTLLEVKSSTKDVDFMVPKIQEYEYLIKQLKNLGYEKTMLYGWQRSNDPFRFDLFRGNCIYTTELLESPLTPGNHSLFKQYSRLYIGILNDYDLISSKLMRGTRVDYDDCLQLARDHHASLDLSRLVDHYKALISYDISEYRLSQNIDYFLERLKEGNLNA